MTLPTTKDLKTIGEHFDAGYTHVAVRCLPCRTTKCLPIVSLPASARALTLLGLAPRLKCQDCGTPPETANLSPWRASDAPGHPSRSSRPEAGSASDKPKDAA